MISVRSPFAWSVLALAVALVACGDGDTGGNRQSPTASLEPTALTVADWADQVCALAVEAGLDVPGTDDPSTLTLDERKL